MYVCKCSSTHLSTHPCRYTRLLAPSLDPLRDERVSFPRNAEEAEEAQGRTSWGRLRGQDDDDFGVVIDVVPKK